MGPFWIRIIKSPPDYFASLGAGIGAHINLYKYITYTQEMIRLSSS